MQPYTTHTQNITRRNFRFYVGNKRSFLIRQRIIIHTINLMIIFYWVIIETSSIAIQSGNNETQSHYES